MLSGAAFSYGPNQSTVGLFQWCSIIILKYTQLVLCLTHTHLMFFICLCHAPIVLVSCLQCKLISKAPVQDFTCLQVSSQCFQRKFKTLQQFVTCFFLHLTLCDVLSFQHQIFQKLHGAIKKLKCNVYRIYPNLEQGQTKSVQLGNQLVKKNIFLYACNQKSLKRNLC